MKTIIVASNNEHKLKEFKEILSNYDVLSLNDIKYFDDIVEDGTTFDENALIKAKTIHEYLKDKDIDYSFIISDDSGLCVDSLNGAPGIYSARYAGNHDSQANRNKLLSELDGKNRSAYFCCSIVVYFHDNEYKIFNGKTYGEITTEEIGNKGFGYDCIFFSNDLGKTFGESSDEEKNSVSHRGRAINEMLKYINENSK